MYYVVQVKTGNEDKVIDEIKKQKRASVVFDAFAPQRKAKRKYKGEWKEIIERCFPGYVFVETDQPTKLFRDLYWIPEFTRMLGRESTNNENFVPLSESESRMVDILYGKRSNRVTDLSRVEIEEGDVVRILDGPLRDLETTIKKVNLHKRKVTIEVTICNVPMEVEVGIDIVARANKL